MFTSAAASGGKKKANSKQKKTVAKAANVHNVELLLARCQQHISGGLYKLIIALRLSDMLPTKGSYPYDDEQVSVMCMLYLRYSMILQVATYLFCTRIGNFYAVRSIRQLVHCNLPLEIIYCH